MHWIASFLATCLSKNFQLSLAKFINESFSERKKCVAFGTEAMTGDSKRHFRLGVASFATPL